MILNTIDSDNDRQFLRAFETFRLAAADHTTGGAAHCDMARRQLEAYEHSAEVWQQFDDAVREVTAYPG